MIRAWPVILVAIVSLVVTGCASTQPGGRPQESKPTATPEPSSASSPKSTESPVPSATPLPEPFAALARPLQPPDVGGDCPTTKPKSVTAGMGPGAGEGPIFVAGVSADGEIDFRGIHPSADGHKFQKVVWVSDASYDGPVLVRGARLDADGGVFFEDDIVTSILMLPAESLQMSHDLPAGWRIWTPAIGVDDAGCYLLQIDGTNFSEQIIFQAVT